MPGGRLETREGGMGPEETRTAFFDENFLASSSPEDGAPQFTAVPFCASPRYGSEFGSWPTTPPRCRRRELDKVSRRFFCGPVVVPSRRPFLSVHIITGLWLT